MAMRPGSSKVNTVLAAWACLILGGGIALTSDASEFALATAAPLAVAGALLLMIGLRMGDEGIVDPYSVAYWEPDSTKMPDAGRVMFRVDTTLDSPIRTSILCGRWERWIGSTVGSRIATPAASATHCFGSQRKSNLLLHFVQLASIKWIVRFRGLRVVLWI